MNENPSQLRLVLIRSQVVASRICCLATRGCSAMSAIGDVPIERMMERTAVDPPSAPVLSAIDALQLPFGFRHGGLAVLGARAEVGEHVDHDEVGDRGCRLLTRRTDARGRQGAFGGLTE